MVWDLGGKRARWQDGKRVIAVLPFAIQPF